MNKALSTVLGLLVICSAAFGQQTGAGDDGALKALEQKWDAANLKGDSAALGAILADTFVTTSSEGKVRTKAEVLAELKSGGIKYQESKVDDLKVSLYGSAAVVTGKWTGKFVEKGKNIATVERFTDTYVKQNGQWRCVASQGSAIK